MKEVATLLNAMRDAGVISNYALFGATAQMRYTEPVATLDVDVLVDVSNPDRLDILAPLYDFASRRGYEPKGETVVVGAWPVQFIPIFSALTSEAVAEAETADFDGIPLRVVKAAHLAVIALSVARGKDFARVLSLLESGAVTREEISQLAAKHGLDSAWQQFERRFLNE